MTFDDHSRTRDISGCSDGLPTLELLDRLAEGEELGAIAVTLSLDGERIRTCFKDAAQRLRAAQPTAKRWPARGTLLDWREMTVAEALDILGNAASKSEEKQ